MMDSADSVTASAPSHGRHVTWDLDGLDAAALRRAYETVAMFVAWLQARDVRVPACWYTHGWVVWRLAALAAWQVAAYDADATAREAVDWWTSGVEALRRDWEELHAHRGRHADPDSPLCEVHPIPSFDDSVAALIAATVEPPT